MAAWSWTSLLWLGAVIPGFTGLLGMIRYAHPAPRRAQYVPNLVAWRIVSRGTNVEALTATILRCKAEMATTPLFPYVIEVVTDGRYFDVSGPGNDVRRIIVPDSYQTLNRSLFKARALHYAMLRSPIPADAWIVHLDEETQPTPSGIRASRR
jgi:egghead protein (zeste-white 4 protein)